MDTNIKIQDTAMYETRDFSIFKILEYNRIPDEKRVEGLMQSIKEHGFLMPILVSNNMEVADGQHRLEAARRLNVKVSYIQYNISGDKLPILISKLNSLSKNWSVSDYYNMWFVQKKEPYIWIGEMIENYNLSFSEAMRLLNLGVVGNKKLKNGELTLTESQRSRTIASCERFKKIFNYSPLFKTFSPVFRLTLIDVISHPFYEEDRMLRKMAENAGLLLNCVNRVDFLFQIERLYNYGEKKQIDFVKTKTSKTSATVLKKKRKQLQLKGSPMV
jgi:hypothetical protein